MPIKNEIKINKRNIEMKTERRRASEREREIESVAERKKYIVRAGKRPETK